MQVTATSLHRPPEDDQPTSQNAQREGRRRPPRRGGRLAPQPERNDQAAHADQQHGRLREDIVSGCRSTFRGCVSIGFEANGRVRMLRE